MVLSVSVCQRLDLPYKPVRICVCECVYHTQGSGRASSRGNDKFVGLPAPSGPRVTGKTHEHKGGSAHTHTHTHTQESEGKNKEPG